MTQTIRHSCESYSIWALKSLPRQMISFITSIIMWLILQLKPLQSLIQYLLTLVTIGDFVSYHGRHPSTAACDQTMDNLDTWIAVCTTVCVTIVLTPAVATIARIIYLLSKRCEEKEKNYSIKSYHINKEYEKKSILRFMSLLIKQLFSVDVWIFKLFGNLLNSFKVNLDECKPNNNQVIQIDYEPIMTATTAFDLGEALIDEYRDYGRDNIIVTGSLDEIDRNDDNNDIEKITKNYSYVVMFDELPTISELANLILHVEYGLSRPYVLSLTLFYYIPIVQVLLSRFGRFYWYSIFWKFWNFLVISLGFWSDRSSKNYNIDNRIKQYLSTAVMTTECYLDCVSSIVTPRAVLWQVIPELTLLTVFTLQTASSPFLGFSAAHKNAFMYFSSNPWQDAWTNLLLDRDEEKWCVNLTVILNFITLWRPFKLAFNLFIYFVTISLVFYPSLWTTGSKYVLIATLFILYESICQSIRFFIAYGRAMDVRDSDLLCLIEEEDASINNITGRRRDVHHQRFHRDEVHEVDDNHRFTGNDPLLTASES
eukprot:gene11791-15778_t